MWNNCPICWRRRTSKILSRLWLSFKRPRMSGRRMSIFPDSFLNATFPRKWRKRRQEPELLDLAWKSQRSFSQTSATTQVMVLSAPIVAHVFCDLFSPTKRTLSIAHVSASALTALYLRNSPCFAARKGTKEFPSLKQCLLPRFRDQRQRGGEGVVRRNGCPKGCFWRGCFSSAPQGLLSKHLKTLRGQRRNGLSKNTLLDNRFSARCLLCSFSAPPILRSQRPIQEQKWFSWNSPVILGCQRITIIAYEQVQFWISQGKGVVLLETVLLPWRTTVIKTIEKEPV